MPDLRIPRRSGAHRIAAIALYRALLTQCGVIPLAENQRHEAQNVVRNRFKQSRHVHSTLRLKVAFEAGYEAIDLLDDAVAGNEESKARITSLLERAPERVKEAPTSRPPSRTKERARDVPNDSSKPVHPRVSLFDRPLPLDKLSGQRHVPVLFNANRIPVLRLKKPQPQALSLYIHKRVLQRQKWHNQRLQLESEKSMAEYEDEWDELISVPRTKSTGIAGAMLGTAESGEGGWQDTIEEALNVVQGRLHAEKVKNRVMAEKMQAIVDRETKLFEKEKQEGKGSEVVKGRAGG